jgi:hypothetical protein
MTVDWRMLVVQGADVGCTQGWHDGAARRFPGVGAGGDTPPQVLASLEAVDLKVDGGAIVNSCRAGSYEGCQRRGPCSPWHGSCSCSWRKGTVAAAFNKSWWAIFRETLSGILLETAESFGLLPNPRRGRQQCGPPPSGQTRARAGAQARVGRCRGIGAEGSRCRRRRVRAAAEGRGTVAA